MNDKIIFKNSRVIDNDTKSYHLPSVDSIDFGEICVNYKKNYEVLSTKNDNNEIVVFPSEYYINSKIESIKQKIFYQEKEPSLVNDGDIWIIPIIMN